MKKRLLGLIMAMLLTLTACGGPEVLPDSEEPQSDGPVIAYVPLDDRPDNMERVEYLAASLGYQLAMPEPDLYRTRLDGQPKNENGTQCGDPWQLVQWVLAQEEAGCDRYILSLDQLHSGGLVNSRSETSFETALPNGGIIETVLLLEDLLTALSGGGNTVWLLDSVMRLAPTVGYREGSLEMYNWIRDFGTRPRKTLTGEELTIENIWESYWQGPNQEDLYLETAEAMGAVSADEVYGPMQNVDESMASRQRKLLLTDGVQKLLSQPGFEGFRLLIGIDDSSLEDCIQKNEIAYLRQGLRDGDWLLSGVDDLAFKALARLYLDDSGWTGAGAAVRYYGDSEHEPACDYDFQPLTEIMAEHFAFFGLTEQKDAALQVLVLTQPAGEGQKASYYNALIADLNACRKDRRPVILIDAGNGRYGTAFHDALTRETELGWLLSYAGFLDMAIVTGTALSHGVARYAVLQRGGGDQAMERGFARTLADSILKDFCYKNVVREELLAYVRNDLGGDPNNFWTPDVDRNAILSRLESGMDAVVKDVVRNLTQSKLLTDLSPSLLSAPAPYKEGDWCAIALTDYGFPWDRAFEISMKIQLGSFPQSQTK